MKTVMLILLAYNFDTTTETLEQGTEPPTAPRVCVHGVCVHGVCVHLDGLNAEHKFRVWVTTILGHTSISFFVLFVYIPPAHTCDISVFLF